MVLWSRDQHYSFTRTMATKLGRVLTSGMRFSTQMLKLSPTSCFISLKYFIINSFQQINFLTSLKHNRDLFPLSWTWSGRYHICIQMNHNWRFLKINCYINWIDPTFVFLDFALPGFPWFTARSARKTIGYTNLYRVFSISVYFLTKKSFYSVRNLLNPFMHNVAKWPDIL